MHRFLLILALASVYGCSAGAADDATVADDIRTDRCAPATPQLFVNALRDQKAQCHDWVERAAARALSVPEKFGGTGTGVVIGYDSASREGIVLTARHVFPRLGEDEIRPQGSEVNVPVSVTKTVADGDFVRVQRENAGLLNVVYSPKLGADEMDSRGRLTNILPEHDFVAGIFQGNLEEIALTEAKEVADPVPGERILLAGFSSADGEFSVGNVLSDSEAKARLEKTLEEDERGIPYDPKVEFLVSAQGNPGMSGGPAFNATGQYVGVLIRASVAPPQAGGYTRVLRVSFLKSALTAAAKKTAASDPLRRIVGALGK